MYQGQVKKTMMQVFHYLIMKQPIHKYYLIVTCSANLLVLWRGKTELKMFLNKNKKLDNSREHLPVFLDESKDKYLR